MRVRERHSHHRGGHIAVEALFPIPCKVRQLRAGAAPPAADELPAFARLDVIGVAEAAQMLAQERDPDVLPGLLFDLVRRHAAAERGALLWLEDDAWRVRAA